MEISRCVKTRGLVDLTLSLPKDLARLAIKGLDNLQVLGGLHHKYMRVPNDE